MSLPVESGVPDEFPARPSSLLRNELLRINSKIEKRENATLVLLAFVYCLYGTGIGFYGPLYPQQAKSHELATYIYGPAMAINFFAALLFYPVACWMITSVSCRHSVSTSIFMIGVCKVLFGTLALITADYPFIFLSYGIQIVEGIAFAILLASTYIAIFSKVTKKTQRNNRIIQSVFLLGISAGPLCAEAVHEAFNFSVPFYGIGIAIFLSGLLTATLLPEPDQKLSGKEMTIVSWIKKPGMLVYFLVVFATSNYTGFLAVTLEPYLYQFHLKPLFIGALFAVSPFACALSVPAWNWMAGKGINSVLLICIASVFIFTSLLLIGPAEFIRRHLNLTLTNVSTALLLHGLGTGGKLASVIFSASRDLRSRHSLNGVQDPLLIPTMFASGSLLGYFSGSLIAGFAYFYLGMGEATNILFGLEGITVIVSFIFAFKRNYRSPRQLGASDERQPILETT
ncbi:uncharacterized protein CDAR_578891 [Caerostris darwini]|uniref:Major facilitator superfamily (MFS) profile domain-containing protein n=1 Tax=Caerostris darwini TaxID=1538125 RepID=A0AAV4RI50_9ARAC|nr:uncharacterized protein CDAR_578891 [Caerostris darwini]